MTDDERAAYIKEHTWGERDDGDAMTRALRASQALDFCTSEARIGDMVELRLAMRELGGLSAMLHRARGEGRREAVAMLRGMARALRITEVLDEAADKLERRMNESNDVEPNVAKDTAEDEAEPVKGSP